MTEYDRDRRWRTTSLVDLAAPASAKVLFDLSANDAYGDPGDPVMETRPSGERVALQDGDAIYLAGDGASETGDRPFLDRFSLATLKKERLFRCDEARYERFLAFVGASRTQALVRSESKTDPPNLYVVDLATGARRKLTDYRDPTPQLARVDEGAREVLPQGRGAPLGHALPAARATPRAPASRRSSGPTRSSTRTPRPPARCAARRTPSPASPGPRRSPS